mgnify:CR=1 FL=1
MSDVSAINNYVIKFEQLKKEIAKVIVGQDAVIEHILISIFSGGHVLLVGVPGLAKTLMVDTIAKTLGLDFKRIQFTPDLMPSDITGAEILDENRKFAFIKGPLFSNIVLADEINRTPPKTQAALLEAMQEKVVTVAGQSMPLGNPFFVLATQNPIEQEGTYNLPEAQLDRFMFNIILDYPTLEEEKQIVSQTTSGYSASVSSILGVEQTRGRSQGDVFGRSVHDGPLQQQRLRHGCRGGRLSREELRQDPADASVLAVSESLVSLLTPQAGL